MLKKVYNVSPIHKKNPQHLSILRALTKTATTYSPTNQQYHRRDEA